MISQKFEAVNRVGIDATPLSGRITGIGRYVLEICQLLNKLMPETEFFLYSPLPLIVEPPSDRWHMRVGGRRFPSSYRWLKATVQGMADSDGIDVFWATRTILPRNNDTFRTVSTVHDLNYLVFPKSMPALTLLAHRLWFAHDLKKADVIVTNSVGTAERIQNMLGVTAAAVAKPGVAAVFCPQDPELVAVKLEMLGIHKPYFLAVGTLEPRKNLPTLVESFISLKLSGKLAKYELLVVGKRGWQDRKLRALLAKAENYGVRWLAFVSDEDLAVLYSGAQALVFPSFYEGFGIPAVEARACGVKKIIATDIPELREAGGNAGIYVSPTLSGIQNGLMCVVNDRDVCNSDSQIPSWEDAARVMADQFRKLSFR